MSSKKIIMRCLLCCLSLLVILSCVGCGSSDDNQPIVEPVKYDKQYENRRFYVQQGYPDGWSLSEGTDKYYKVDFDGTYADGTEFPSYIDECGLVATFTPDGVSNVKYNIYTLKGFFMRATQGDMLIGILGKSSTYNFEFNNLFIDDLDRTPRDAFVWSDTIEDNTESIKQTTVEYNKITFQRAYYEFTVDGVDWKGMFLVTLSTEGFHVITLETEKSVWDENYTNMEEMLTDFRLLGFEEKKD